jgi:hypothetical protein
MGFWGRFESCTLSPMLNPEMEMFVWLSMGMMLRIMIKMPMIIIAAFEFIILVHPAICADEYQCQPHDCSNSKINSQILRENGNKSRRRAKAD